MPQGLNETTARIRSGADEYMKLFRARRIIRNTLSLTRCCWSRSSSSFPASGWLSSFQSRSRAPLKRWPMPWTRLLPENMNSAFRSVATGEMGDLVRSFNHMAADLETSRHWRRRPRVTAANQAVEERRRELETIVETIPSGVVTLDGAGVVLQSNRAFAALMGPTTPLPGEHRVAFASRMRRISRRRHPPRASHGRCFYRG